MNATATPWRTRLLRHSGWDALLVGLAFGHGLLLLWVPSVALIAVGLWWNTNTIGHNFIHLPFFRSKRLNQWFAAYLSILTGVPQALWRERHLAHHRGEPWRWRPSTELKLHAALIAVAWMVMAVFAPRFFLSTYIPGYLLGLALCHFQGHYEHARGVTSHYGRAYNWLFFNDGYHAEHHARPGRHWTQLKCVAPEAAAVSRWPAVLRWLEAAPLEALEKLVLRWRWLRHFVLRCHRRAWVRLLQQMPRPESVTVVGGGLFPRTALLLHALLPGVRLTVVDADPEHVKIARQWLDGCAEYRVACYSEQSANEIAGDTDLLVFPLAFRGQRAWVYESGARITVVHDWIWRRRGLSVVVSPFLLKRMNLIVREG